MKFFDNLFTNGLPKNENAKLIWNELTRIETLDDITEISKTQAVVIFKHSTRCSISKMVLSQFEENFELKGEVRLYFLNLLLYREISNQIASRFNVHHQSPQMILIKKGIAVYNASHEEIKAEKLMNLLADNISNHP